MDNAPLGNNQQPAGFPPSAPSRPTPPPPPPPPEITLRTMKSDIEGLRQGGGTMPEPKPFTPPEFSRETLRPTPPPPPPPPRITPADFSSPRPTPSAPTTPVPPLATPVIEEEKGSNMKKMVLWGGVLILIIAAGLAGYYYLYPLLFPAQTPPPPVPAVSAPPAQTPAATATTSAPAAQGTRTSAPLVHHSLFTSAPTIPLSLASVDMTSVKLALQQAAAQAKTPNTLTELVLNGAQGQVPASGFLPAVLPEFTSASIRNLFNEDFTTALFTDANGSWPVYVFQLNASSSPVQAQPTVASLETSTHLPALFAADPGTQNPNGFKSGQASGVATRYLTFSKTGASLNFGWVGDKLIISTSYAGFQKTLGALAK